MPNRIIKESICSSESLDGLSWFEEVFFYRLMVNCDDYGRLDARPAILKAKLFPLKDRITNKDISGALGKLADAGCVRLYECDSKPYLYLPAWEVHQRVRNQKGKYPAPESDNSRSIDSNPPQNAASIQSNPNPNPNPKENAQARVHTYGEYGWVKLTDAEYAGLIAKYGEAEAGRAIRYVDESAQSTGNKNEWKDWNLTVRKCIRDGWGKGVKGKIQPNTAPEGVDREADFEKILAASMKPMKGKT